MMFFPVFCKSQRKRKAGLVRLLPGTAPACHNFVHQTISRALLGIHETIALSVPLDDFEGLSGVLSH
jgi:hypothetical protein